MMDPQISVFLLFLLFTAGHSLKCYECSDFCEDQTVRTCSAGYSWCYSNAAEMQIGSITSKGIYKGCSTDCRSESVNIGITRVKTSCCNTDLCNQQDPLDLVPNGKKCYTCDEKGCSKTLSCSGDEDRCITATGNYDGQPGVVKGCVSKSLCVATASIKNVQNISCCEGNLCNCEGNLCNGAPSVSQSFLFLCGSLLSYFLLH